MKHESETEMTNTIPAAFMLDTNTFFRNEKELSERFNFEVRKTQFRDNANRVLVTVRFVNQESRTNFEKFLSNDSDSKENEF
tara:strand:- start:1246 stop:1491 length:246 start_codon:yes stop_codon:yes gene_type:complete